MSKRIPHGPPVEPISDPQAADPDELIPTEKAAKILHQKPSTLVAWRSNDKGPAYFKLGRRCFYRRTDLLAWINTQRTDPAGYSAATS
jgi:Helix-turn-helix domain